MLKWGKVDKGEPTCLRVSEGKRTVEVNVKGRSEFSGRAQSKVKDVPGKGMTRG